MHNKAIVGLILLACIDYYGVVTVNAGAGIGDRGNFLPKDDQNYISSEAPNEQTDMPISREVTTLTDASGIHPSQEVTTVSHRSDDQTGWHKCPEGFGSTGNTQIEDTETLFGDLTRCQKEIQEYDRVQASGPPRLGMFHPECEVNGDYKPVQCLGSRCYCVRTHDGLPLPYFGCYDIWQKGNLKCAEPTTTTVFSTITARPTQHYFFTTTKWPKKKPEKKPKHVKFDWDLNNFFE